MHNKIPKKKTKERKKEGKKERQKKKNTALRAMHIGEKPSWTQMA